MALATKCPHCNTIFRVAADQLKLRGGIVRCGTCNEVFDGNVALIDTAALLPPPVPAAPPLLAVADEAPAQWVDEMAHHAPDPTPDHAPQPIMAPQPVTQASSEPAPMPDFAFESAARQEQAPSPADGADPAPSAKPAEPYAEAHDAPQEQPQGISDGVPDVGTPAVPFSIVAVPPAEPAPAPAMVAVEEAQATPGPAPEPGMGPPAPSQAETALEFELDLASEPVTGSEPEPAARFEAAFQPDAAPEPEPPASEAPESDVHGSETPGAPQPVAAPLPAAPAPPMPPIWLERRATPRDGSGCAPDDDIVAAPPPDSGADAAPPRADHAGAAAASAPVQAAKTGSAKGKAGSDEPGFVRQGRRRQRLGKALTALTALAVLALLGALLAQGVLQFRNQLAAQQPQLKPALTSLCAVLGCRIDLPAQIDQIAIEQGELQTLSEQVFSYSSVLRNQSSGPQAWPSIELILNDADDKPVLRRVFAPRDYLPPAVDPGKGFAARSEQAIKLYFELTQLKASGYHIAVFYP